MKRSEINIAISFIVIVYPILMMALRKTLQAHETCQPHISG